MKRITSLFLALLLLLNVLPTALAAELGTQNEDFSNEINAPEESGNLPTAITEDAEWAYLDDNTDPAGDPTAEGYIRTSWTAENYNDSAWETGVGPFGSKKGAAALETGYTATTVLDGCTASNDTPAYFFRTQFQIDSLDAITQLVGTAQYDDGLIIYINGVRVAAFEDTACDSSGSSLGTAITENLQYGGSNGGTPKTSEFTVTDLSMLHEGVNTVAVELHQGRASSSDIWFAMTLAPSNEPVVVPPAQTDISLSVGADQSQMNFTWYAESAEAGTLLIAKESELPNGEMPDGAARFQATAVLANDGQYSNQVTATGLEAGTIYAYQLVNGEDKSAIHTFTTDDGGAFSFAYVADPQIGASGSASSDTTGWDNTLNIVAENSIFSEIAFMLSAGDQVNTASSEDEYDGYLNHDALLSLPVATIIGNHDSSSDAYSEHFHVANESAEYGTTTAGGDSYFVYNNVLFMVLNSNDQSAAEHKAFMEAAIAANPDASWKIVSFHHSIYSVASHATQEDILNRRDTLVPIFKELDIDVVLMGHDHVYVRSYMMDGLNPMTDASIYDDENYSSITDPTGILYVTANSGSGSKYYNIQNSVFAYSAVQNQERVPNVSKVSVSENQFTITTYRTSDMSVVDTFTINRTTEGEEGGGSDEPTTEPGAINTESAEGLVKYLSSYSTGNTNADGGVAEIVKFNADNNCMYLVSGQTQTLDIVKVNADGTTELVKKVDIAALGAANGFSAGDITSVDVNTVRGLVAIAVQHSEYDQSGVIVTLDYEGNFVDKYDAGVQPDMVTFTPNGKYILSANEGEPRNGYGTDAADPMGSVTVVDLATKTANTITFEVFDRSREQLITDGVLLKTDTAPSVDLEPEYIAVSADSKTAYITLQENNAIAALNLTSGTWKYVKGLGFKDHSLEGNGLDLDVDGMVDIRNESVYGVYMPDGIAVITIGGKEYLLTANEGDAREWGDYVNTNSAKLLLSDGSEAGKKIEYLDTSKTDGLTEGNTYVLGARSFSIWDAATLKLVFDSGDDFETITAEEFSEYFNSGHDEAGLDKRSNKKGVEPENVAVLETNGKIYAIIGLERMGGIMVYDITDPANAAYADYLNVRDFAAADLAKAGDLGPEGICTIPASQSPTGNAMILVANEISGTVTVAQIEKVEDDTPDEPITPVVPSVPSTPSVPAVPDASDEADTPDAEVQNPFVDVIESDYYADAVLWAVENGVISGTSTVTFSPDGVCTRAQIVTFLWRAAGSPAPVGTKMVFEDVPAAAYYYDAVLWAMENGITTGTSETTFSPDAVCTRAQSVTFLWRAMGAVKSGMTIPFADVAKNAYYADAVKWAVANGVTSGTSATAFSPDMDCTRAQIVTFLWRAMAE